MTGPPYSSSRVEEREEEGEQRNAIELPFTVAIMVKTTWLIAM